MCGLDSSYKAFDLDIMTHINSTFFVLNQLGVGPENGFTITGEEETWNQYINAVPNIEAVKSYMYAKVRILFDPPTSSFVLDALQKACDEYEWRLNVQVD